LINVADAVAAKTPKKASQSFTRSTGTGPIEAARGSVHLVADDGSTLSGETDIMGQAWTGTGWAPKSTAGTAWSGGVWNGNTWTGTGLNSKLTVDWVTWAGSTWRSVTWTAAAGEPISGPGTPGGRSSGPGTPGGPTAGPDLRRGARSTCDRVQG
jgi:serine protease AprX